MTELICALAPDSAGTLVTGLVRQARTSLDVAMYEVGPSYAWALGAAARRGIRVRLLLDGHRADGNAGTAAAVMAAGGSCRVLRDGAAVAHWKLVRVDGRVTAVGTGNLIWRDAPRDAQGRFPPDAPPLPGTREWWVATDAAAVSEAAAVAVETAWERAHAPPPAWARLPPRAHGEVGTPLPQVPPLRIQVAPGAVRLVAGGLPVAAAQLRAIESARARVLLTVPYASRRAFAVRRLVGAARRAAHQGADARLLLGAPPRPGDAAWLASTGLPVRCMDPALSTRGHAKGIVADGVAVITSANWSRSGLGPNWELALVVRDETVATYLATAWERDWASARALADIAAAHPSFSAGRHGYARPDVC